MKMISCYKQLSAEQQALGGVGQGGGLYWTNAVGILLQQAIAGPENTILCPRPHGRDSYDRTDYAIPYYSASYDAEQTSPESIFDLAYLQLFDVPIRDQRPAKIVYSIISDYVGLEALLEDFLERAKPDFLIAFQYPHPNLDEQCKRYNCRVIRLPWFNVENFVWDDQPHKPTTALCSGKMGGTYPMREAMFAYLKNFKETNGRDDIVLSGIGRKDGATKFTLTDEDYRWQLGHTKYVFSGGIYDYQIPPKYFEICNHGATLVSPDMPLMKEAGFIDGETYIKIGSVEQIPSIIKSDAWKTVGPAGQKMVHERHSIKQRAKEIRKYIFNGLET